MSPEQKEQTGIRLTALDRALSAWEDNREYVEHARNDVRTPRILATAKAFEAYLRGDQVATDG